MYTLQNASWTRYLRTTTVLVVLGMLAWPALSYAQANGAQADGAPVSGASADVAPGAQTSGGDNTVIVVTGVRASQQSGT